MRRPAPLSCLPVLLAALLAACSDDSTPAGIRSPTNDARGTASTHARRGATDPDPASTDATATREAGRAFGAVIEQHCGEATMHLAQVAPLRSALRLKQPNGGFRPVAAPPGLVAYSPLGIDCVFSPVDGRAYFLVEFGVPRKICRDCTWPLLFDAAGRPLNGGPPNSLGDGRFDVSAFEALRTRLGLGAPQTARLEWK